MKYMFLILLYLPLSCRGQKIEESIVLINAGKMGRAELADLIDKVNQFEPKVVAIDFQFRSEGDPEVDNKLVGALKNCKNLVMVSKIAGYSPERLFHQDFTLGCLPKFTKNASTGFANLMMESGDSLTLRRFSQLEYVNGREELSFAMRTAYQFDSIRAKSYMLSHKNFIDVNFENGLKNFKKISTTDLLNKRVKGKDIDGKIVMIGFLGPGNEDKFFVQIEESREPIYGLEFHAQIVSQILQE